MKMILGKLEILWLLLYKQDVSIRWVFDFIAIGLRMLQVIFHFVYINGRWGHYWPEEIYNEV